MGLNYERLKYFLQAAKTQNFSEAARQIHISPQAFGKQIALFEDEIGMQLFFRQGQKKLLTPEGEIVYRHMAQLSEAMENEYEILCMMGAKNKTNINVGLLTFLPREPYLEPVINEILKNYGGYNINIKLYEMPQLSEALLKQELDFAITLMPAGHYHSHGYNFLCLETRKAMVAISMYNPLVIKNALTETDLHNLTKIRFQLPADIPEDPYPPYPCEKEEIVENYGTLMSHLEQKNGYALMVPEWSNLKSEYHISFFDMPEPAIPFELLLLYRKSLKSDTLTNMLDDISEHFET